MQSFVVFTLAIALGNAASFPSAEDDEQEIAFASGRIINGHEAQTGEAPYIVSLKTSSHFCAGSIIDRHWVLTAAHCLTSNSFEVVAGLHSRNDEKDIQIRDVKSKYQYVVHEQYSVGGVGPNDIGLIYIPEGFDLSAITSRNIAPVASVALPSGKHPLTGPGRLFGWGRDNSGYLPNNLQTLDTDIIGYAECKSELPFSAPFEPVNICSYNAGKTDGSCNGDSGGPLVRYTPAGVEQVGIVSWIYVPCANTRYPSVYTSVNAYKDWIKKTMESYTVWDPRDENEI